MIGFFRRIRKKMSDDNKPMKYIRYAIGEIVLVMVGILLALQVNNWNEARKNKVELNDYLLKIAQNIKEDIQLAQIVLKDRETRKLNAIKAREMISQNKAHFETMRNVNSIFAEFYFTPNKSGYETLKSSGYLGKLKNANIDSLLHEYYTNIDNIKNKEISLNEFIERSEASFTISHSPIELSNIFKTDEYSILEKEQKLRPFIYSYPFQSVVFRTAIHNNDLYRALIKIGNKLIEEIEGK